MTSGIDYVWINGNYCAIFREERIPMTKDFPLLQPHQVPLTEPQRKLILVLCKEFGWTDDERYGFCHAMCGVSSVRQMTMADAGKVIDGLNGYRFGLEIQMQRPG